MDTTRLELAAETAEALQRSLRRRQDDVLHLEKVIERFGRSSEDASVVVDQATDLARALRIHVEDLGEILTAAETTRRMIDLIEGSGPATFNHANELMRQMNRTQREAELAERHLIAARNAVRSTAQSSTFDPELRLVAATGVTAAASEISNARRAVFRLTVELPDLSRAIDHVEERESPLQQPGISASPEQTLGQRTARRHPGPPTPAGDPAFSPGR